MEINVNIEAHMIRTVIVDHGMGIPPDYLPHRCERFFRGKNVTLAEIPGSGFGLHIAKSIVQEMRGTLEVESVLQKGTTITVTLCRPAHTGKFKNKRNASMITFEAFRFAPQMLLERDMSRQAPKRGQVSIVYCFLRGILALPF